jgi:6-phosphogluconolactonase (cycloisomerase 2 family)
MSTPDSERCLRSLCAALVLVGLSATLASGAPSPLDPPPRILSFVEAEYERAGLDGPLSPVVSPDGEYVYVVGEHEDAVVVYERDTATGALTYVEALFDGVGPVDGLDGVDSATISPDGDYVYTTSWGDDAVTVFSCTTETGELTYVEALFDGVGPVDGLEGAWSIAISPDGNHAYVAGYDEDAVAVFSRNATTGKLTFVEAQRDGSGPVDGLDGARSVAVSPDGRHVYVASEYDDAVAVFTRSVTTGGLTFVEMKKDGVDGVDGLDGPGEVLVSPDGDHVYVTGHYDNAVTVFGRNETTGALTYLEMKQDGVDSVDGLYRPVGLAISPDGGHVYVGGALGDTIVVFSRNGSSGALGYVETQWDGVDGVDGLDGIWSLTVSPDGGHVYTGSTWGNSLCVFGRNETSGALTFVESHRDPEGLDGARSAAISPDENHLYVASREDDAVAVFQRDGASGAITFLEALRDDSLSVDGLDGANSVAVSPDGNHVYVASVYDDAVATFARDVPTGTLEFVQVITDGMPLVDSLSFATSVAISPDGKHVYVTAAVDNAITAFWRHPTTGQLTVVEDYVDGDQSGFVDGLAGAYSVAISPDGYHVYVAGGQDDALACFVRNSGTGELAFFQVISDTGSVVNGLDRARSVAISPDGHQVYVASMDADTLTVYDRNPNTGNLSFVEIHQDGVGGVSGLDGAHTVAVSPDGKLVYAAGSAADAVVVFRRDAISGTLTFEEVVYDNTYGIHGLEYPASVTVSPDGNHVYVTGFHDDSVAVFERHLYVYLPLLVRD